MLMRWNYQQASVFCDGRQASHRKDGPSSMVHRGKPYYHCHTPICRLVRCALDRIQHMESKAEKVANNYSTMQETALLLHCNSIAILLLTELGYLHRPKNDKTGKGNAILISKTPIENFNKIYIYSADALTY